MKYKNPRLETLGNAWTRIPAPHFTQRARLRKILEEHESDGHYWVSLLGNYWWVEKAEDATWVMLQ